MWKLCVSQQHWKVKVHRDSQRKKYESILLNVEILSHKNGTWNDEALEKEIPFEKNIIFRYAPENVFTAVPPQVMEVWFKWFFGFHFGVIFGFYVSFWGSNNFCSCEGYNTILLKAPHCFGGRRWLTLWATRTTKEPAFFSNTWAPRSFTIEDGRVSIDLRSPWLYQSIFLSLWGDVGDLLQDGLMDTSLVPDSGSNVGYIPR